jgi:hypothetical protein
VIPVACGEDVGDVGDWSGEDPQPKLSEIVTSVNASSRENDLAQFMPAFFVSDIVL